MLTLVVVAKDEGDRLARCLRSVPGDVDRWVVLDASTRDDTHGVALREGARVVVRPWPGHVAQKNFALSLGSRPWVLSLDADEWLTPAAADAVWGAIRSPGAAVGFSLSRCSEWLGRPIRGGRWYPDRKVRLVRRGRASWVGDDPHDRLLADGPVRRLRGDIGHEPYRSVLEHLRTIDRYTAIQAGALHARGVRARPWDPWLHPTTHFVDAVLLRAAWRDGVDGLAVAALGAAHAHLKWRRLRALR